MRLGRRCGRSMHRITRASRSCGMSGERLNPRHRKELRMLAEALALQQNHARLPEAARGRLDAALGELDRVIRRIAAILAELARRTPPVG